MRKTILATLALTAAITTQARANYEWRFFPTTVIAGAGIPNAVAKSWLPQFDIIVTNAAFATHSLNLSWGGCNGFSCQIRPIGNFAELVDIQGAYYSRPPADYSGQIHLSWAKYGNLLGSGIDLAGEITDLTLSDGAGGRWSGLFASDANDCGMTVERCHLAGYWHFMGDPPGIPAGVPEPAAIGAFLVGLGGLAFAQQKRRRSCPRRLS